MVDCPTCGQEGFASKGSMKSHHTRVHGFKLGTYESEQEWLLSDDDIEWTDENIDRFVAQVGREIKGTADKFDLDTSLGLSGVKPTGLLLSAVSIGLYE